MTSSKGSKKAIAEAKKLTANFRGVSVCTRNGSLLNKPFRAQLFHNHETYALGYYVNADEAAMAYNKKAKSLFKTEKNARLKGRWNELN